MAMFGWNIAEVEAAVKRSPSADLSIDFHGAGPVMSVARPRNLWSGGTCRCMLRYAVRRKIAGEEVSTCIASIRRPSK